MINTQYSQVMASFNYYEKEDRTSVHKFIGWAELPLKNYNRYAFTRDLKTVWNKFLLIPSIVNQI